MKTIARTFLCLTALAVMPSYSQIYDIREMTTVDIRILDLDHTVIIIPAGILEQHGPYLPSYTDGYRNEYFAQHVAKSIVSMEGWTVLMFPPIPLGVGGANQIGKQHVFPGTYHVHFSTLRAMFMDLASEFGEAGFQWIFVISHHGAPSHQRALDQASDFFNETYDGTMVYLSGLKTDDLVAPKLNLSIQEEADNGLDVHGGMSETGEILFLRPDLVRSGYRSANSEASANWRDLVIRGGESDWPGYFGAPHLATASRGAKIVAARSAELSGLALRILDGFDHTSLERKSAAQLEDEAILEYDDDARNHAQRIQEAQRQWLHSRGLR